MRFPFDENPVIITPWPPGKHENEYGFRINILTPAFRWPDLRYLGFRIEILLFFGLVVLFTIEVYWEIEARSIPSMRHFVDIAKLGFALCPA
jgi:hypothetical protein